MNRQTGLQAKEAVPLRKNRATWLHRAAVRPVAEAEHELSGSTSTGFDLTSVPVRPQAQTAGQASTRSCPMSPQRCPFGGACHSCPPRVQAKLKIGQPGDKYELEADRVAEQVMRMPEPQVQRKGCSSPDCKEEDEDKILQAKSVGSAGNAGSQMADHPLIQNVLSSPGQPLDAGTRSFMEPRFGQDFSGVRVHTGGQAAESARAVNARAYTVGRDVVFGEGLYASGTDEGRRLVAHELVHVGQQNSCVTRRRSTSSIIGRVTENQKSAVIQRYSKATGTVSGAPYRLSDDMTAAVKVGYPNHDFYAKSGKVTIANASLARVASGIELKEESSSIKVSQGSKKKTLKKVMPTNKQNSTSGDTMKLWDDCGDSAGVVVGGTKRTALHYDAVTGSNAKTVATSPSLMKAEIMKKLMNKWLSMASTSAASKKKINDTIAAANAKQLEIDAVKMAYPLVTTDAERKIISDIYWAKVDEFGNIMMSYYNSMSESKREKIDKYLKINKFTSPSVGQGYTMSSGGRNYPGVKTWNFHWGGVVMKSDDNKDNITLENYAMVGATKVQNDRWDFAMYGTEIKGQTFHEQHHDTKQHGDKPTTMTIKKK